MGPLACQRRGYLKLTQSRRLEEEEERGIVSYQSRPGPVAAALVQICYSYRGCHSKLWPAHIPTMHCSELHTVPNCSLLYGTVLICN